MKHLAVVACVTLPVALASVSTPLQADELHLSSGETIRGTILESTDTTVRFAHPVLGELTVPRDQVTRLVQSDAPPVQPEEVAVPTPAAEPAKPVTPGLFGTTFLQGWNRRIELAVNGSEGNTETFDLRAGFGADYEDEHDRWRLSALYARSENDNETSRNEFTANVTKDWLFPDRPYFIFGTVTYEYDQLQSWEHRVSAFGGIGYTFVQQEKWDLRGRAGIGGNYRFEGEERGFTPEAMLGLETEYRFTDKHKIIGYTNFFPALESPFQFRNVTGAAWQMEIDRDLGLSLKLGVENEYESEVAPGEKHNDFKYYAGLLWAF